MNRGSSLPVRVETARKLNSAQGCGEKCSSVDVRLKIKIKIVQRANNVRKKLPEVLLLPLTGWRL